MTETYIAWDGLQYPWPPPAGWELKSDGRYWPTQQDTPPAPETAAPNHAVAQPAPGPPASGPTPQQSASPTSMPTPAPSSGGSKTGLIILLSIVGFIVLIGGSCVLAVNRFAGSASDAIDEITELGEEYAANQEEARAEVTITENGCRIINGRPTATVRIANRSGGRSDYTVGVTFTDESGRRLTESTASVDSIEDGEDVVLDIESFDTDVTGDITCGKGNITRFSSTGG
jgi:hypothetical protein